MIPNDNMMEVDQESNISDDDYEEDLYNYEEDNGNDIEDDIEDNQDSAGNDFDRSGIKEALNCVVETINKKIDPIMMDYINNIRHQIILLGKCEITNPKIHGNILGKGQLTDKQKNLYKYINKVLQTPACIKRCETWWAPNTIRNYRYAIRDYVTFMAESTIDGNGVDENNFEVDGIHIVKCMDALIKISYEKAGRPISGFNRKLSTFKRALEGLQHLIALYHSSNVENERERENVLCEMEKVKNLHLVKNYLAERRKVSRELQTNNFDDKDRDNMFSDRYSTSDLIEMSTFMCNLTGKGSKRDVFEGINASLELLVGHHLLFRGDDKRSLELSDTTYTVQETSLGKIPILGFQLTHSRTLGPDERPLYMGACRNKNVECCIVSSVAFSLWYRFDFKGGSLTGANFPNFLDKKSWYPIKLLFSTKTATSNKMISYNHENSLIKKCLSVIGRVSKKTTLPSRKQKAQNADANQINGEQIMRAGHLMNSAQIRFYLSPYPFDFILQSAGFKQDEPYFIPRNIEPPSELKKMIFPWLEEWVEKVNNRPDQRVLDERERDGVIPKFLQMLDSFRSIIIQDLVVWMDKAPDSIYCTHEITKHPSFIAFREAVRRKTNERSIFQDLSRNFNEVLQISSAFVRLITKMKSGIERGFEVIEATTESLSSMIDVLIHSINRREQRFDEQKERIQELESYQGRVEQILEEVSTDQKHARDAITIVSSQITELNMSLRGTTLPGSVPATSSVGLRAGSETAINPSVMQEVVQKANENILNRTASEVTAPPLFNPTDPRYALNRTRTVMESLDEWYVSTPSFMSISERDRLFGIEWRRARNKQTYKRKRVLIKFLTYLSPKINGGNLSVKQLGWLVEKYRMDSGRTLPALIERLERRSPDQSTTNIGESCKEDVAASIVSMWSTLSNDDKEKLLSMGETSLASVQNF